MAKLMIGSFGTLAAIAVVNFKLQPRPHARSAAFVLQFATLAEAIAARDAHARAACSSRPRSICSNPGRGA